MTFITSVRQMQCELGLHFVTGGNFTSVLPHGSRVICACDNYLFCFIESYQNTVFAVRVLPGGIKDVCPLAYDFKEFVRLAISCGSGSVAAALGFCLLDHSCNSHPNSFFPLPTERQGMAERLCLEPVSDPYSYLNTVIRVIDTSRISF